jgi:hypothetical protein
MIKVFMIDKFFIYKVLMSSILYFVEYFVDASTFNNTETTMRIQFQWLHRYETYKKIHKSSMLPIDKCTRWKMSPSPNTTMEDLSDKIITIKLMTSIVRNNKKSRWIFSSWKRYLRMNSYEWTLLPNYSWPKNTQPDDHGFPLSHMVFHFV